MGCSKGSSKREVYSDRSMPQETGKISNKQSNFTHKGNRKEEQTKPKVRGFLGGTVVKNLPANAGDTGSSPGPGRSHMPQSN